MVRFKFLFFLTKKKKQMGHWLYMHEYRIATFYSFEVIELFKLSCFVYHRNLPFSFQYFLLHSFIFVVFYAPRPPSSPSIYFMGMLSTFQMTISSKASMGSTKHNSRGVEVFIVTLCVKVCVASLVATKQGLVVLLPLPINQGYSLSFVSLMLHSPITSTFVFLFLRSRSFTPQPRCLPRHQYYMSMMSILHMKIFSKASMGSIQPQLSQTLHFTKSKIKTISQHTCILFKTTNHKTNWRGINIYTFQHCFSLRSGHSDDKG